MHAFVYAFSLVSFIVNALCVRELPYIVRKHRKVMTISLIIGKVNQIFHDDVSSENNFLFHTELTKIKLLCKGVSLGSNFCEN